MRSDGFGDRHGEVLPSLVAYARKDVRANGGNGGEERAMTFQANSSRAIVALVVAMLLGASSVARAASLADGTTADVGRGINGYPCVESKAKYDLLQVGLLRHRRNLKLRAMEGGIFLERGDRVRVVAHAGRAATPIRLKIESGSDAGKACWIDPEVDDAFVNVRPAGGPGSRR